MSSPHLMHLTPDDLDALLLGTEQERVHVHLETCAECRALVVADRNVVVALESLPSLAPRAGFADRVMAGVTRPVAVPRRLPALARAAALGLVFLGGLAASISWSLANEPMLMAWREGGLKWAEGWLQLGLSGLWAELSRQSWYATVLDAFGSPTRLTVALAGMLLIYGAGLVALRRLTALPSSGTASHAA
ncbi:MAG: hypothetical protein OEW44_01015 [Gemmatimonadota bacterium]|jgi:hypothetical protein|nr:hypothetical protein [Gemmatimonadota bacterium]